MAPRERNNSGKSGFTLIEIVAVFVIIAMLAAVAMARYVSLITDSQRMALTGGVAAGQSECSLTYGKLCMQNATAPSCAEILGAVRAVSGDIVVGFSEGDADNEIKITATHAGWTPTATGRWTIP